VGLLAGLSLISAAPAAAAPCPNEALRSGSSALLPDCRAYELASPSAKNGFDVLTDDARAAASGSGIVFEAQGALPGGSSAGLVSYYLSRRASSGLGWDVKGASPPLNPVGGPTIAPFFDWSSDLSKAIVQAPPNTPLAQDAVPTAQDLYVRDNQADTFSLVSHSPGFEPRPVYGGASADFAHVVYSDAQHETQDTPDGAVNEVYEQVGGQTRLVGVLPDDEPVKGGIVLGSGAGFGTRFRDAVSVDGSKIVFTSRESENAPEGQIYVRIDGSSTVEASASKRTVADPNGVRPATYWDAASDGSSVFFTSPSALTDDANTGPTDAGSDLYRFDVGQGALTDLSVDASAGDPNGAEVLGVVGTSRDGSSVYFTANAALVAGEGVAGEPNLYRWHEGAVQFIATLSPADENRDWKNSLELGDPPIGSRVSGDGTEALITTVSAQPGYDNVDPVSGEPHAEIYRFDAAATPPWTCVSCNPSGAPATADAALAGPTFFFGNQSPGYMNRALSSERGSVFFNSAEQLVQADQNNTVDAYEWNQGELSLISTGQGEFASYFLDADTSGENAYIATRDRLAPQDTDNLLDVYDVRVDGGIPAAAGPPSCGAEPCRGPASGAGNATNPGTSTFAGPGNPKPKPRRHHRKHHKKHHRHPTRRTNRG
jgi:hypothetical protein